MAETLCVSAFLLEISRALGGNTLSWAYVFEWPIFAVYAVYMWRKLLEEERAPEPAESVLTNEPDDEALAKFNEYLREVHGQSSKNSPE